jgi:hypothetical protein
MSYESMDSFEDHSVERPAPKRLRKSFDKRRAPVSTRGTSHQPAKSTAAGVHRRRRRHYGL